MNAGKMNQTVALLELVKMEDDYNWGWKTSVVWAKAEKKNSRNLFSSVGLGADTMEFTIRRREISLENALCWRGRHCFITDISEMGRLYYKVTTALVNPVACRVTRTVTGKNELNNPVVEGVNTISFPACLTEKYMGYEQKKAESVSTLTYVLVTPKVIDLAVKELVYVGDNAYEVIIAHTLDAYKNEYEITRRKDN